jgi:hypothetical protein
MCTIVVTRRVVASVVAVVSTVPAKVSAANRQWESFPFSLHCNTQLCIVHYRICGFFLCDLEGER